MERLALVDLGSNSARLVVYAMEPGVGLRLVDEIREVIRLGEDVSEDGRIGREGIERAIVALRAFSDYTSAIGVAPPRVMATSAVRGASNRDDLLQEAAAEGVEIELLSGSAEAAQGVLAVANTSPFQDAWVADLGGGSLQLSRMCGRRFESGAAYPLGAIRASERFLRADSPAAEEIEALRRATDEILGEVLSRMRRQDDPVVAMGGTIRNLARAVQRRREYPWRHMHAYFLHRADLDLLVQEMSSKTARKRGKIAGINPYRGDIILAGAIVYQRLLHGAGRDGLTVSGFGMREGALFERFLPSPHRVADVRQFAIDNLLWRFPQPHEHTERVKHLSHRLFEVLADLHRYGDAESDLLSSAATVHDIGTAIEFRDHAKHGSYLISGAPMPGYDHRQQALLSLLVRYHRGGSPSPGPYRSLLQAGDERRLQVLATCLVLAEHMDRSRTGRVRDLEAVLGDETVVLSLIADRDARVELWETQRQAARFEAVFGRRLEARILVRCRPR